ncbi:MAG: hypothetical protein GEU75_02315 [Dehalococcoidia bacterium]|nr:hypothetical protein [Dehalococcoidia bacterium]
MASPFSITAPSGAIALDANGRGDVQFSITNISAAPLRGRALIAGLEGVEAAWLTIAGEPERDFPVQVTHQCVVQIQLPPGTPGAQRRFRLDMVGVANPDEVFTQGPTVTFSNPAGSGTVKPELKRGYVAAIAGALIGMLAGASAGIILGVVIGLTVAILGGDLDSLLTGFVVVILISLPGPWLGSALGVWYNLRNRGYDWALPTALGHAVIFPALMAVSILILSIIGDVAAVLLFFVVVVPACIALPPLGARAAVLFLKTGKL